MSYQDVDPAETEEWEEALDAVLRSHGKERAKWLLDRLRQRAQKGGIALPYSANTPYVNTIATRDQPQYPGNIEIERRIRSVIRWNALVMVVRANKESPGIGGHISTFASSATLYEVGFNHFFRGKSDDHSGDQIYFQGHGAPGIYARAWLLGRLTDHQIANFRRELHGGVTSYPHPWLMPKFWEYPTVSMGLAPLAAIYQARFNKYLLNRGLKDTSNQHVWAFLGDGETDEPEALGALTLASREYLDNLIFVVNCNLQRLDGPVRGNGKIIQELEAAFRGAGWNVIKVIWGGMWDGLLERDTTGALVRRMGEVVDGEYQKYVVAGGAYIREHFFNSPELKALVEHLSDEQLARLNRGGHDPHKLYAAFKAAVDFRDGPTVILAKTIKGYGLGEAGEGRNITHQQKKLNEDELREFRSRFGIPIPDDEIEHLPFYKLPEGSDELEYLRSHRQALGGYAPGRLLPPKPMQAPSRELWAEFFKGSEGRELSTTMAYVRMLAKMLKDPTIGKLVVPIVPDEARTFGMDALFRQVGIYSSVGQLYEPVDREQVLYYREAKDGQILEEGITEAGSMASFIAAGTAYSTHGVNTIPMFIYYSMFGFQRIGDSIWMAADARCKGFLLGGTAGRTTLAGEGLQHQDGQSHIQALVVPNLMAYDPAYAYEIAIILQDGIKRMYELQHDVFYYVTLMNENYEMPPMPAGVEEGILRGLYRFSRHAAGQPSVKLLGSGAILNEVRKAAAILADKYGVSSTVYSATSYKELKRDAMEAQRWNLLHPDQPKRTPYVEAVLAEGAGPVIAASDYMRALPETISTYLPGGLFALGTDGFGRSEAREALRRFFEVDAAAIVVASLHQLSERGEIDRHVVKRAIGELGVNPEAPAPWTV